MSDKLLTKIQLEAAQLRAQGKSVDEICVDLSCLSHDVRAWLRLDEFKHEVRQHLLEYAEQIENLRLYSLMQAYRMASEIISDPNESAHNRISAGKMVFAKASLDMVAESQLRLAETKGQEGSAELVIRRIPVRMGEDGKPVAVFGTPLEGFEPPEPEPSAEPPAEDPLETLGTAYGGEAEPEPEPEEPPPEDPPAEEEPFAFQDTPPQGESGGFQPFED